MLSEYRKQHKNLGKSRDKRDIQELFSFLVQHNPFSEDASLRNITTRVTAATGVYADIAKDIGSKILHEMVG